jgi:hypothetical protein
LGSHGVFATAFGTGQSREKEQLSFAPIKSEKVMEDRLVGALRDGNSSSHWTSEDMDAVVETILSLLNNPGQRRTRRGEDATATAEVLMTANSCGGE